MAVEMWLSSDDLGVQAIRAVGPRKMKARGGSNTPISHEGRFVIIEIRGTLTKYGSPFGPATIELVELVRQATADPTVSTIVLWVDSGGGEVQGIVELANAVAIAKQKKLVITLVDGVCASGAYFFASQSTRIYATTRIDSIGSIGVVLALIDSSGMLGRSGVKMVRIRSGELKGIGLPGTTISDEETEYLTQHVRMVADEFVMAVSTGRKLPPDQVRQLATGAVWPAMEAVRIGLIDGIASREDIIAEASTSHLMEYANLFAAARKMGLTSELSNFKVLNDQPQLKAQAAEFHCLAAVSQKELCDKSERK